MDRVAIAIGSNLGNRHAFLETAVSSLRLYISHMIVSDFIETRPVGVSGEQPLYLNGVISGDWDGEPRALLDRLLEIECQCGRERPYPGAPRTVDLDLILHGSRIIVEDGLQVPHPRFREREFVLRPLAQVAPDMIDPVTGLSADQLLTRWKERNSCA